MTSEYEMNLCCQCDQKFLMQVDGEICQQCLFKRDAFHYQRGLTDARAETQWVSVADWLPGFGSFVLAAVIMEGGARRVTALHLEEGFGWHENDYPLKDCGVTHWQPLPEPPK